MGCCNYLPGPIDCCPTLNEELAKSLDQFTGDVRKAMKLLCKQYEIRQIHKDPDIIERQGLLVVREMESPVVITYFDPREYHHGDFEWKLWEKDFKN